MSDLTDTAQTTTGDAAAAASPGNGRLVLALIAGIPLTVILAASWMWYFVVNGELDIVGALGTANRGELVQPPRQALDAGWTSPDGTAFALAPAARWTLVIPQAQGALCRGLRAAPVRSPADSPGPGQDHEPRTACAGDAGGGRRGDPGGGRAQ
jgi:hypothetical protein